MIIAGAISAYTARWTGIRARRKKARSSPAPTETMRRKRLYGVGFLPPRTIAPMARSRTPIAVPARRPFTPKPAFPPSYQLR